MVKLFKDFYNENRTLIHTHPEAYYVYNNLWQNLHELIQSSASTVNLENTPIVVGEICPIHNEPMDWNVGEQRWGCHRCKMDEVQSSKPKANENDVS